MKKMIVFLVFMIFLDSVSSAQQIDSLHPGKAKITLGIAFPELMHIGIGYQKNQHVWSLSVGGVPGFDGLSLTGSYYYHFGAHSRLSDMHPLYLKGGLSLVEAEEFRLNGSWTLFNACLGRDFYITPGFGIELEAGLCIAKKIIPEGGFKFFFTIKNQSTTPPVK